MKQPLFYIFCVVFLSTNCSPKHVNNTVRDLSIANSKKDQVSKDMSSTKQYVFPDDWLGYWSGDLNIYNSKGLKQTVPMSLDLAETDTLGTYTWAIIYGQDSTAQRRDYQLKEIDTSMGHYLIDEKNGILLDAYHIHNELSSVFEVMGNTLLTSYKLEHGEMVFSVKLFPSEEVRISGDTIMENQDIPKVSSFQLTVNQIARLQKKCLVE